MKNSLKCLLTLILFCNSFSQAQTVYSINTQQIEHQIDINIYGQFLEHIYNSANNGLWGDMIWNSSFEQLSGGDWEI